MNVAAIIVALLGFVALVHFGTDAALHGTQMHHVVGACFGIALMAASLLLLPGAL